MIERSKIKWRGFYYITDHSLSVNGVIEDTRMALEAGSAFVQYRMKFKEYPYRETEAAQIRDLCRKFDTPFIINDDVELAVGVQSDGVHLGQEDLDLISARKILGASAVIGVSVASLTELNYAVENGADYVAASPVFFTSTKQDILEPVGLKGLKLLRANTDLPLCAIGGIKSENISAVVSAGADLVCAISASLLNGAVIQNINNLKRLANLCD